MKRRSFLGLLSLAPAVPLAAGAVAKQLKTRDLTPEAAEEIAYGDPDQAEGLGDLGCSVSSRDCASRSYAPSISMQYNSRQP